MGQMKKEGKSGARVAYISRARALRKLQLTLKDFRRLCILKGIYPVEPKNRRKVSGGNSAISSYYLLKDIKLLSHEPLIWKFWDFKIFMRKISRAKGRREYGLMKLIKENRPWYKVDHLVRERYPTFTHALKDLDDALSMLFLYASLSMSSEVPLEFIEMSRRLSVEFLHYVIETRSLRKAFISLKGYYFQASIMDTTVTWVVPHKFVLTTPTDVDLRVMKTFTEFYITLLGFVNFKLFASIGLFYPPKVSGMSNVAAILDVIDSDDEDVADKMDPSESRAASIRAKRQAAAFELLASLNVPLDRNRAAEVEESKPDEFDLSVIETPDETEMKNDGDEGDQVEGKKDNSEYLPAGSRSAVAEPMTYLEVQKLQSLFSGLKFFLAREVPREVLTFLIRSFGGQVSWDETSGPGSSFPESDETITHQIIDRPSITNRFINRTYVQPQWIVDSINTLLLLNTEPYFPGRRPPPHLSPFVAEREGDYLPAERIEQLKLQGKPIPISAIGTDPKAKSSSDKDPATKRVSNEDVVKEKKVRPSIAVRSGKVTKDEPKPDEEKANRKLAEMMIPKKRKHLYEKMVRGQKRRTQRKKTLEEKKAKLQQN